MKDSAKKPAQEKKKRKRTSLNIDVGPVYRPHYVRSICSYDLVQDSLIQASCPVNKSYNTFNKLLFHDTAYFH